MHASRLVFKSRVMTIVSGIKITASDDGLALYLHANRSRGLRIGFSPENPPRPEPTA